MRSKLARVSGLTGEQWSVVLISLGLVPAIRISLRLQGFMRTARFLAARSQRVSAQIDASRVALVADAVSLVAGQSLVGARCLGRSLATWFLLRRRGVDAELVIGVQAPKDGELPAHAWVEVVGQPLNDEADVRTRFGGFELPLPRLADPNLR